MSGLPKATAIKTIDDLNRRRREVREEMERRSREAREEREEREAAIAAIQSHGPGQVIEISNEISGAVNTIFPRRSYSSGIAIRRMQEEADLRFEQLWNQLQNAPQPPPPPFVPQQSQIVVPVVERLPENAKVNDLAMLNKRVYVYDGHSWVCVTKEDVEPEEIKGRKIVLGD